MPSKEELNRKWKLVTLGLLVDSDALVDGASHHVSPPVVLNF